jgi:hypothetical protein
MSGRPIKSGCAASGPRAGWHGPLLAALAGFSAVAVLICALNWFGISHGLAGWRDLGLQRHQVLKLAAETRIDTLLVGDSTLGNAIDAEAWSRQTGEHVLSLALTGDFGYAGSLNNLRRAVRRHRPQRVILMHTAEMPTRPVSWSGLVWTAERVEDLAGAPPVEIARGLFDAQMAWNVVLTLVFGARPAAFALEGREYPAQRSDGDPTPLGQGDQPLRQAAIVPAKMEMLDEIGRLCRGFGIRCFYAHGPYVEPQCSRSAPYFAAVNARIAQSGLKVIAGSPRCMARHEAGDAEDHAAPAAKAEISAGYLALLRRTLLAGRSAPATGSRGG